MDEIKNIQVLLVEDNEDHAFFIAKSLDKEKFKISNLADGKQAYDFLMAADENNIDVVLLDYHLPQMDGLEIMRKLHEAGKFHAFVFLTVDTSIDTVVEAMKAGALDFLPKTGKFFNYLQDMIIKVYGLHKDRLDRLRIERELQEREQRLKTIINAVQSGIVMINHATRKIIDANPAAAQIIGLPQQEIIGKDCHEFFCTNQDEVCINKDNCLRNNDISECLLLNYEKKHVPISRNISTVNFNNETFLIESFEDITERKRTEELRKEIELAEKSAKFKQQFLANMSHEMRTPMTGILGMIEFLLKTKLDPKQLDYVNTIQNSSKNLLNLINDILDLSKIEEGKMQLKPVVFNIHDVIKKIKGLFDGLARQKEIQFIATYSNDLPDYIKADENRVTQIISNLVSNAVKFTEKGNITLNYMLSPRKVEEKIVVKIEVVDTGIGISQENQKKLFTKFTQLDSSLTRSYEGTGLGLAICKELSQLMGGDINLISELGKGSNFWFEFEAELVTTDQIVTEHSNDFINKEISLGLNILVVEDKLVNQKVVKLMLENIGCQVVLANNGLEAINYLEDGYLKLNNFHFVDIVLMDIQMPIMDGITAVKHLRTKYNFLPPIIGLSANAMEGDAENYIAQGMDDYMAKPVSSELLLEKLQKWSNKL